MHGTKRVRTQLDNCNANFEYESMGSLAISDIFKNICVATIAET